MKVRGKIGADKISTDLFIDEGIIKEIRSTDISKTCDLGREDLRIAPGLIDIQINGYDGVDFNDPDTNSEQIVAATRKLWRTGVTAFCPTIITESSDHIAKCISNLVRAAFDVDADHRAREGPFISPEDGPRGA